MALSHDSIFNMYRMNFVLMTDFNYSLKEIENMMPFEREIYIAILQDKLQKEQSKRNR